MFAAQFAASAAAAQRAGRVLLRDNIERPLRYHPDGTDFVITNGSEFFNRPLYCMNTAFRADGGDKPEFSLYVPGRGGNLRFGLKTGAGVKWLNDAREIVARYQPGSMHYNIRDPLLGSAVLNLVVLPLGGMKGIIARAELWGAAQSAELVWAFGGANGMKGSRNGDIGCEREPVSQFFQLRPEQCRDNAFSVASNSFVLRSKVATLAGMASAGTELAVADANHWADPAALLADAGGTNALPVVCGLTRLADEHPVFLALFEVGDDAQSTTAADLPQWFAAAEEHRRAIAERVRVDTPDPFINAAAAALNIAADAVWDEKQQSFMHGAVAWRVRLLGWRGPYVGDELGWHERTAAHFAGFAKQQNTSPIPEKIPPPDENVNLARNETALHSNGDLTKSHYDMNLVAVDAFFRHLLWTGDTNYAREMWPVIERHLAWERRLFRREFGADKLPLYEAYAAIWASDNLQYNGGGATHASAYNYWHNRMAARVAKLLGADPAPYEREADLIWRGMHQNLWLTNEGWFGEFKDYAGLQLVHPSAGLWTFYHTVDSAAASPFEAWQMTRFVDTQIAHIPIRGPGVPAENLFTLPETDWMPYNWSINNVVMAEVAHASLGYWQANRADTAFAIFKGCVMDSMYLGLCPGNVGAMTGFDMARGEAQRDFADGCGATSRALVEGLFGVQPDVLDGVIRIRPGFPADWDRAGVIHPDFKLGFLRGTWDWSHVQHEVYVLETRFPKPLKLQLQVPALTDHVVSVQVNGRVAKWRLLNDSVGVPRIEIDTDAGTNQTIRIGWSRLRPEPAKIPASQIVQSNAELRVDCGAKILELADPQGAVTSAKFSKNILRGTARGAVGHRTVFARVEQGDLRWWQPVTFEIRAHEKPDALLDWARPVAGQLEPVDLTAYFNDLVTQIFRNNYVSPRPPFCSLAMPKQGLGGWCEPTAGFVVDDSGLRAAAARGGGKIMLPNGVPLQTPGAGGAKNIVFTSQWDNYPREASIPLHGKSSRAYLLLAGSTNPMQSQFDNGEIIVTYADGTTSRLALRNPTNWWPVDQDYYQDDFAFRRDGPIPPRVDLRTGSVRLLDVSSFKGQGGKVPGGAATVLWMPLDGTKELKTLTVRTLANEVVIGLMSVTLER